MKPSTYRLLKRALDLAGSCILFLFFLPISLLAASLIKLTSKGPVFYSHVVIGKDEKPFGLYKFRTMYANNDNARHLQATRELVKTNKPPSQDEEGLPLYKIKDDHRVTWVGKYLRKFSLDEIPQFVNVLKGEMSLVGPRPSITYEYKLYKDHHRERLRALPGITGLYQVTQRYRASFDEMVELDLQYIHNPSLLTDIKILLKTPWAMLKGI